MSVWEYEVRRLTLENYDDVATELQNALAMDTNDGFELVSCFPEQHHNSGMLHDVPVAEQGSDPYDAVWQTPTGPVFIAVFKHRQGE